MYDPLIVRESKNTKGFYDVIDNGQRLKALQEIYNNEVGRKIKCLSVPKNTTDKECIIISFEKHAHRKQNNPYEICECIKYLTDEKETKKISMIIGLGTTQMVNYKKIIKNNKIEELKEKKVKQILREIKEVEKKYTTGG